MVFQFSSSRLKDANVSITSMCTAAFLHHQLSVVLSSTHADRCSGRKLNSARSSQGNCCTKRVRWSERRQRLQQVRSVWPVADYVSLVFTTPRPESARYPIDCLCGLGGRAFETTPAGVNLSLARPMAPRPRFSGGRAVPRHIIANDGAGCPKNYSWLLTGFGLRD